MKFYEPTRKCTVTPTGSKLHELTICYLGVLRSSTVEPHMPVKRLHGLGSIHQFRMFFIHFAGRFTVLALALLAFRKLDSGPLS
jgi:hypothetical protein